MAELAEIFCRYGAEYRRSHRLPLKKLKTMSAIEQCRTASLGGHVDECDACGHLRISYNSCRNRHCPKCQGLPRAKWLANRNKELLPVEYFHVVFTIPDELNPVALRNQAVLYNILFKAASETLLELSKNKKYLGADTGFISILHTWGQNLLDHPHLHCVVPGGGLSADGKRWTSARKGFFIPVKVLSRLFKGKFLAHLKEAYQKDELIFPGEIRLLKSTQAFQKLLSNLYAQEWVVYCKPPFGNPKQVLNYLGRYTHRVAISNHRIVNVENGKVSFRWRDYRDGNKKKLMTLEASEFIRRFLLHILPSNFVKIRYYGILSNGNRKTKLKKCQELLDVTEEVTLSVTESWEELLFTLTGIDLRVCPCCEKGRMHRKQTVTPRYVDMPMLVA